MLLAFGFAVIYVSMYVFSFLDVHVSAYDLIPDQHRLFVKIPQL